MHLQKNHIITQSLRNNWVIDEIIEQGLENFYIARLETPGTAYSEDSDGTERRAKFSIQRRFHPLCIRRSRDEAYCVAKGQEIDVSIHNQTSSKHYCILTNKSYF